MDKSSMEVVFSPLADFMESMARPVTDRLEE
jgi:hypothetical protein